MKNILRLPVFNEEDIILAYIWNQTPGNEHHKIKFICGLYYGKNNDETLFCFAAAKFQDLVIFDE